MCCRCGFVHRDDRILFNNKSYRAYKPHYHWKIDEIKLNDITFHATICVACCNSNGIDWDEFYEQTKRTPEKYKVQGSLNAPLPDKLIEWASELYNFQSKYFLKN